MLSVFNDDFLKFSSGNNLFYTQQDHYIHFPLVVTVCGSKIWFSWTLFVRPLLLSVANIIFTTIHTVTKMLCPSVLSKADKREAIGHGVLYNWHFSDG